MSENLQALSRQPLQPITEQQIEEQIAFFTTPSNRIVNNLTKGYNERLGLTTLEGDGRLTLQYNDLFITATNTLINLLGTPALGKAFDIFGARIQSDGTSSISLAEYMEYREIKDKKQARKELKNLGTIALNAVINYDKDTIPKTEQRMYEKKGITIFMASFTIAETFIVKDGKATMKFTPKYTKLALMWSKMLYNKELAKINDKLFPSSYYLGRKLCELMNMRRIKNKAPLPSNTICVSINALLDAARTAIPTEEEVAKSNRAFRKRIIGRFEVDLNALKKIGSWKYCKSISNGGAEVSQKEADKMDYYEWKTLSISFTFIGYKEELERQKQVKESGKRLLLEGSTQP